MIRLTNFRGLGHRRWCSAIVLVTVLSLALSVITRYAGHEGALSNQATVAQKHASLSHGHQRLLKDAAIWIPPVLSFEALPMPGFSSCIVLADGVAYSLVFEGSLYNRPPPAFELLS